jgi:hypothetical protein
MLKPTIFLALGLAAAACREPALTDVTPRTTTGTTGTTGTAPNGGIWAGNVLVQSTGTGLRVNNNTTRPIGYFAIESRTAERVRWAPCVTATNCATIPPGEGVISAGEIMGATRGSNILFYWWHLVPGTDGTLQPDSMRTVTVKL